MSTIHLHQTTTATPEQFVAGLTDFGPGRSKLFGNSADESMTVILRPDKERLVKSARSSNDFESSIEGGRGGYRDG